MSQHRIARAAVLSAGSWGTAVAKVLADAGTDVIVHARRDEIADGINARHRNPGYFPDVELPVSLTATTDPAAALDGADYLVLSIPAQSLRANLAAWAPHIGPAPVIVSLMKGIELGSGLRASQVITEVTGVSADRVAVLSGPNLAAEIMAASRRRHRRLPRRERRPALPAGLPHLLLPALHQHRRHRLRAGRGSEERHRPGGRHRPGRGLGDNAGAMLITRGLAETTRLAVAMGAHPATLAGLAGLGDLVATCTSPLSRNRTFGTHLGHGLSVVQATTATRQTTEGVKSAEAILALAQAHGVEMPITQVMSALLHEKVTLDQAAATLMQRPAKPER